MKMKALLTLGLLLSPLAYSKAKPDSHYPCDGEQLHFPENSTGTVYSSKNCKVGYLPLKPFLPIKLIEVKKDPIVTREFCDGIKDLNQELDKVEDQIVILLKQQYELVREYVTQSRNVPLDELKIIAAKYSKALDESEEKMKKLQDRKLSLQMKEPYSNTVGAVITYKLSLDQKAQIKEFKNLNKNSRLKFRPAPIQNGIISLALPDESIKLQSILGISIPGMTPKGEFLRESDVKWNSDLLVDVSYSQLSVCSQIDNNVFPQGGLVANFTYEVQFDKLAPEIHTSDFVSEE